MELVKGIPITKFCDEKQLTPRERLELFIPVCQAVQHAHQKGIIHRDLKPSNVLIALYDGQPVPKVIDFGVAKATGGQLTEKTLVTHFGSLVGTLEYMSPEQAELNQLDVDTRSDIYSLGVLLYELLTGSTPLDRERMRTASFHEKLRIIREEEAETVSARIARTKSSRHSPRDVPQGLLSRSERATVSELDWIVMKALEKDRSRRYESASAFAADIQRYLSDEPVLACPPTTMYRFQKFARKHKPALATAAAIALCLILGTTVSAWQAVRATQAEGLAIANEVQAKEAAAAEAQQRQRAEANEQRANAERDEVKALADKLAAKEQQLQRTLYAAHMNLAHNAWDAGGIGRADQLLEQYRPKEGETDLRSFEWHYLHRLCHPELLTLKGHMGTEFADRSVAFSPDGKRLAFSSRTWDVTKDAWVAGGVKVCDAQTGHALVSIKGASGDVHSMAFSPDGKHLAGDSAGRTVKVWDSETGQELVSLKTQAGKAAFGHINSVAFSPDGKHLAIGGDASDATEKADFSGGLKVWDAQTGQELLSFKAHTINSVAFSPDGKRLATGGWATKQQGRLAGGEAKIWDALTGAELLSIKGKTWGVQSVAFSPDGKRLVGLMDSAVKVWDTQTGQELLSFKGHTTQINSVAFSPDGRRLASASWDKTVKVWDAQTGEELLSFKGHTGGVNSVVFNPNGTRLASASKDGTVRVWDASTSQEAHTFSGAAAKVRSVGFSPDGKRLTGTSSDPTTNERALKVWDAQSGQELLSIKTQKGKSINRVTISPDGKRLAAGIGTWDDAKSKYVSGEVQILDAQTGRDLVTFKGHTWPVADVAFSPDSSRLVSCSSNVSGFGNDQGKPCEVKVWDVQSGEELLALKGHKSFVNSVAYSPDGKRLATLSRDNTMKVWDARTGQELLSLPVRVTMFGRVAFSPDGKLIASSNSPPNVTSPTQGGEVILWDARTGDELFTLQGHTGWANSVVFSPDGKRLASGAAGVFHDLEVKVWDVQTGQELLTFEKIGGGGVAFSPDGHRLVSAGTEGLKIFDATPVAETP